MSMADTSIRKQLSPIKKGSKYSDPIQKGSKTLNLDLIDSESMDIPYTTRDKKRSLDKEELVKSKKPIVIKRVYPGDFFAEGSFKEVYDVIDTLIDGKPLNWASVELPNPDIEKIVALHMLTIHKREKITELIFDEIKMTRELSTGTDSITQPILAVVTKNRDRKETQYIGNEIDKISETDKTHITDVVIYQERSDSLDKYFEKYLSSPDNLNPLFLRNTFFSPINDLLGRIKEKEIIARDFKIENIGLKDNETLSILDIDTKYTDTANNIIAKGLQIGIRVEKEALLQHSQIIMRILLYLSFFSYFTKNLIIPMRVFSSATSSLKNMKLELRFINNLGTGRNETDKEAINDTLSYFQTLEPIFEEPNRSPIYMVYYYVLIALLNEIHYRYNKAYFNTVKNILKEKQYNLEIYLREKLFLKEPMGKLVDLLYYITGNTSSVEINYTNYKGENVNIYISNGYLGGSHKSRRKTYRRKPGSKKVKSRKSI